MRKISFLFAICLMTVLTVKAQKIVVVDVDGDPIPLAMVLTADGNIIGTTNLNGEWADVKGAAQVLITHVAYKPQLVSVASLKDGRIIMEDQDYGLRELEVTPKPYLYIETYYRAYAFINDSLRFYQAGIMPNAYDEQADKVHVGNTNNSSGYFCPSFGAAITWGARLDEYKAGRVSKCLAQSFMNDGRLAKKYYTTTTAQGSDLWLVSNREGTLGRIEREKGTLRMTIDAGKAQKYANKVDGKSRLLKMREQKKYEYQFTEIFNCQGDEKCNVEDFVMYSHHWQWDGGKGRMKFVIETYAIDRSYMNKKEFSIKKKELKKAYAYPMPLEKLEEYERSHNIPALSPAMRSAISKMK